MSRGWIRCLRTGFVLLCLRFQIAAVRGNDAEPVSTLILIAGGFGLGILGKPWAAFAYLACTPLMSGLDRLTVLGDNYAPSLVLSAFLSGDYCRRIFAVFRPTDALPPEPMAQQSASAKVLQFSVLALATSLLVSLGAQIDHSWPSGDFSALLWRQPMFGFGDRFYFLTAAFVWLQGIFLFTLLLESARAWGDWLRPLVLIWAASQFAFVGYQLGCGYFFYQYALPYEDFHAFGSVAVTIFAYLMAGGWPLTRSRRFAAAGIAAGLSVLVAVSGSRASWVAWAITVLFCAGCHLSRRWVTLLIAAVAGLSVLIAHRLTSLSYGSGAYFNRLLSLAKLDDSGRTSVYHRAMAMIDRHPLTGQGIGSFYWGSLAFVKPGERNADVPNFAHNFFLQLAAELGVPITLLFIAAVGWTIVTGWNGPGKAPRQSSVALAAYLLTQLTANSLNIYLSQQVLFWFLMAGALLGNRTSSR